MIAAPTPGVWYAREWTSHAKTSVLVDAPGANVLGVQLVAECETEADARLVAAAPQLRDLLLEVQSGAYDADPVAHQNWLARVDAALARVGGLAS